LVADHVDGVLVTPFELDRCVALPPARAVATAGEALGHLGRGG
jgi:hypothetical protein